MGKVIGYKHVYRLSLYRLTDKNSQTDDCEIFVKNSGTIYQMKKGAILIHLIWALLRNGSTFFQIRKMAATFSY